MNEADHVVSLAKYLRTSYRPDSEWVDGLLRPKPGGEFQHGVVQGLLGSWFRQRRHEWGILVSLEVRTQVNST